MSVYYILFLVVVVVCVKENEDQKSSVLYYRKIQHIFINRKGEKCTLGLAFIRSCSVGEFNKNNKKNLLQYVVGWGQNKKKSSLELTGLLFFPPFLLPFSDSLAFCLFVPCSNIETNYLEWELTQIFRFSTTLA